MNIDTGLAVVIVAVLVFYLRLIILQRERIKRVNQTPPAGRKSKKTQGRQPVEAPKYSILSQNPRDLIIAGAGVVLIAIGVLLYMNIIPIESWQAYWWIPTAIGIVAFSWGFKL